MGVANSPLRDRVVFVQGAPRSGTTWLVMLLATHPQIAGVETESHLFEFGVDRLFDNLEFRHRHLRGLSTYVDRDELIDLVRDLCDGVFLRMRSRVAGGEEAKFVVEKTPTSFPQGSLDLKRKRECFPDAWYVHIVRDGEAVTRSLMRAPFMADRSPDACRKLWEDCVGFTREVLGDHPRYREVSYELMRSDPARVAGELFEWLGVDASEKRRQLADDVSRERFSELGDPPAETEPPARSGLARGARRVRRLAGTALERAERRVLPDRKPEATESEALAFYFVQALRKPDLEQLRSLTTASMSLTYRSPEGDLLVQGDDAREALVAIADQMFRKRPISEWIAAAPGGPRVWWTRGRGQEFWTILLSNVGGDATRVDVALGITPEGGKIAGLVVISAGPLRGRALRELSLDSLRSAG